MKTLAEFSDWLEVHGRHAEIIVCQSDWARLWERVSPDACQPNGVIVFNGRRIRPMLDPTPLDVSATPLFD